MMTSYIQLKRKLALVSAEHQHAAGLDLKACNLLLQLLCHTSRLLTSASKNPLLRKRLYNCYMYERLYDYYNPYAL